MVWKGALVGGGVWGETLEGEDRGGALGGVWGGAFGGGD